MGPEKPLVEGIVDYLENYNIKVFGPNKLASQLEGSKYLQNKYVKNSPYQQLILVCLKQNMKHKNFRYIELSCCN